MLPITARLDRVRFQQVLASARQLSCRYFVCKWQQGNESEKRFAVVISQAVGGNAVKRNRKRRQVYEAIRRSIALVHRPVCAILFAKKSLVEASFQDIEQDIIACFRKL